MESATYFGAWCRMQGGSRAEVVKWMMKTQQMPIAEALALLRFGEGADRWVQLCSQCGWVEASEAVKYLPDWAEPDSGVTTELDYGPWQCDKRCPTHGVRYLGKRCPVCFGRYAMTSVGGSFFVREGEGES